MKTHETNAGSLRTGDVIATGFRGYEVLHVTADGTRVAVAARSLYTRNVIALLFQVTEVVPLVPFSAQGAELEGPRDGRGMVLAR